MNPVYKSVTPAIICAFLGGSYSVGIQNSRKQKAKEGIMKSKAAKYLFDIPQQVKMHADRDKQTKK